MNTIQMNNVMEKMENSFHFDLSFTKNIYSNEIISNCCKACFELVKQKKRGMYIFQLNETVLEFTEEGILSNKKIDETFFMEESKNGAILFDEKEQAKVKIQIKQNNQKNEILEEFDGNHRGAVWLTENTDAVVICVSQETQKIRIFLSGCWIVVKNLEEMKKLLKICVRKPRFLLQKDLFAFGTVAGTIAVVMFRENFQKLPRSLQCSMICSLSIISLCVLTLYEKKSEFIQSIFPCD